MNDRSVRWLWTIALTCASCAAPAVASASEDLFQKHACAACHAADRKNVGPALKDIAKKYKGKANAVDALAGKIQKGSSGVWGQVPMPANPAISAQDAKALAAWVLEQ
jgi:cytochrome c